MWVLEICFHVTPEGESQTPSLAVAASAGLASGGGAPFAQSALPSAGLVVVPAGARRAGAGIAGIGRGAGLGGRREETDSGGSGTRPGGRSG